MVDTLVQMARLTKYIDHDGTRSGWRIVVCGISNGKVLGPLILLSSVLLFLLIPTTM